MLLIQLETVNMHGAKYPRQAHSILNDSRLFSTEIKIVETTVTVYHVIWYTLLFSLVFLELKIKILEYEMSNAKI